MSIPLALRGALFVNLATRRKNGDMVPTPVWMAEMEDGLYIFSQRSAGKVKRIKNFPAVRVAECTANGALKGTWFEARASLVKDPRESDRAYAALRQKYGWKMRLLDLGATVSGKIKSRALLRLDFEAPDPPAGD